MAGTEASADPRSRYQGLPLGTSGRHLDASVGVGSRGCAGLLTVLSLCLSGREGGRKEGAEPSADMQLAGRCPAPCNKFVARHGASGSGLLPPETPGCLGCSV